MKNLIKRKKGNVQFPKSLSLSLNMKEIGNLVRSGRLNYSTSHHVGLPTGYLFIIIFQLNNK
jgi:hypothetical protein